MKIEKIRIEKIGNQYRVRKQIRGKKITLTFDHEPDTIEIAEALATHDPSVKGTFEACAKAYIASKSNVLSPSTLRGYNAILRTMDEDFKQLPIAKITQIDIQRTINERAAEHKAKTARNLHGFISAVLRQYRPSMRIYTTLPKQEQIEYYTPSEDDIQKILEASEDRPFYHIPFQLGIMSLRRSEICALTVDDIKDNILTINKAMVMDTDSHWIINHYNKSEAGTRKIYIPQKLVDEIQAQGFIYEGNPGSILDGLNRYQDKLGMPRFRFHDLRHFYASYAHSMGISDADIMATGGWKSDFTMKRVYRHEMKAKESQQTVFDTIIK